MLNETVVAQLLTLFLSAVAFLMALGRLFIGRVERHENENRALTQVRILKHEMETVREKSDIETRELVNDMLQHYIDENNKLQEKLRLTAIEYAEERGSLQNELAMHRKRIDHLESQLNTNQQHLVKAGNTSPNSD